MTNKIHTHLSGSQNWPKEEGFGHVEVKGRGNMMSRLHEQ